MAAGRRVLSWTGLAGLTRYRGRVVRGGIDVGELGELGELGKHGKGGEGGELLRSRARQYLQPAGYAAT